MARLHEAWNQGFDAGIADEPTDANPYPTLTEKWFEWADGWKDATDHQQAKAEALDSIGWFGPSRHQ